jgi:glycoprotein-N-acetylgalactosamine 3-beta-galactosyltransferase
MVGSTKTDESINAVEIPHEGPEEYDNIWQKVRSMWSYIYDNFYDDYDWFHIGGDDLYLIVENLRLYLESEEIRTAANGGIYLPNGDETTQTPLFLGRRFAYMGKRDTQEKSHVHTSSKLVTNSHLSCHQVTERIFSILAVQDTP